MAATDRTHRGRRASAPRSPNADGLSGPVATVDEKVLLARYAETRDPSLKEELVNRFLPLARSMAYRYRGGSEPLDDLTQVASLGLVKALDGYDPERGSFVAYAVPTILGELRRHFRDRIWAVRLPRDLGERTIKVQQAARRLGDDLDRTPTAMQIAEQLGISEEEVAEALQADQARRPLSFDMPLGRDDPDSAPMIEGLGDDEKGYDAVEAQFAAEDAALDEPERLVIQLRFEKGLSQHEIGDRIGVSQMQVSRIMRRGLRKLLDAVQGVGEDG
jgi:RNA polymerase sigma-B factor